MFGKFKYVLFSSNIPYTIWSEVVCGTPELNKILRLLVPNQDCLVNKIDVEFSMIHNIGNITHHVYLNHHSGQFY